MAFEITKQELLRQANELLKKYNKSKDSDLKAQENRLRRIVSDLDSIGSLSSGVTSFNTRTGAVTLTSSDVITALGYTPSSGTPTLDQVTTAGNTTANSIGIGTTGPIDFNLVVEGVMQVRNAASSFTGLRIDSASIRRRNTGTFSLGTNDATSFHIFAPTNNIGINTTTDAGYKLDVNGTAKVRGNIYLNDSMNRYIYGFNGTYIKLYDNLTGGLDIYNNGGIGATRNYGALEVYGNFTTTGSFTMNGNLNIGHGNYLSADSSSFNKIYPYNGSNANMRFIVGHPTAGDFDWEYPLNTVLVRLKRSGNLLIGTTTDAGYKLDVNGTAKFTAGGKDLKILDGGGLETDVTTGYSNLRLKGNGNIGVYINLAGRVSIPSYLAVGDTYVNSITPPSRLLVTGSQTATSALAQGVYFNNTLVAAANNDVLVGLDINPTFNNGAFTGVGNYALRVNGLSSFQKINASDTIRFVATGTTSRTGFLFSTYSNSISSGAIVGYDTEFTFTPFDGNATYTGFAFNTAIQQSGTATGITRGVYINPILTSAYDFRAIETTRGKVVLGSSSGNVLIGTTTDAGYKLDVNGTARVVNALTAGSFVKSGGTSAQFLKADGSIDSNTYLTTVSNLGELHDVYVPTPSDGDLLRYNASNSRWESWTPSSTSFKIDYDYNIIGAKDGINTNFSTTLNFVSGTTRVFLNGQRLTQGVGYDYVEAGTNQVSLVYAPLPSDQLIIEYQII